METNSITTEWVELPPVPSLPALSPGISIITFDLHWVANTTAGQWGVRQYRRDDDDCTILLGYQSVHIPMSAPKLVVTTTGLLLAIGFLLVAGAMLLKPARKQI